MAGGATATAQGNTQATAIALSEVSVAFRLGGGGLYTAVERATLNVADGEFVAIVGRPAVANPRCSTSPPG